MREISGNTKVGISLAALVAIVTAAGGAAWKAQGTLTAIQQSVQDVSVRITSLETNTAEKMKALEIVMGDRFTKTAAAEWALRMKVANPTIKVPDPRDPSVMLGD